MKITRLHILLLLLSIAGCVSVWADTKVIFNFKNDEVISSLTTLESGEVKLLFERNDARYKPRTDGTFAYLYNGNTLNITANGHPIKSVVFSSPTNDTRLSPQTISVGECTYTSNVLTWTCNGGIIYSLDVNQNVNSTLRKLNSITVVYDETTTFDQPAPPTFSIEGMVKKGTNVEISSNVVGASIYYTTDGSVPTTSSNEGTFVTIDHDMTIRAIAVMFGVSSEIAEATYTIQVESTQYEYVKVTDGSTLHDGDVFLVVNEDASKAMGKDAGNYRYAVDVTIAGDKIVNPSDDVDEVTLEKTSKLWYLLTSTGYLYANQTSNNYVRTSTTKEGNSSKASISITNGNAEIKFQGGGKINSYFQYYGGTLRFSCYYNAPSTSDKTIQLYRKTEISNTSSEYIDFSVSDLGFATLYYSDKNFIVPSGLTARTYHVVNDQLLASKTYLPGQVIPASTGVVFQGNKGNYLLEVTEMNGEGDPDNMLKGFDEDALTVGDGYYYKLSTFEGENIGFYWGAENGEAFISKAHKAYLVAPTSVSCKGFAFDWTSGVEAIPNTSSSIHQDVYTLGGQRVHGTDLPKGIYIVNGKKMVVR